MAKKKDTKLQQELIIPAYNIVREAAIVEENNDSISNRVESRYFAFGSVYDFETLERIPQFDKSQKTCRDIKTWRIFGTHATESDGEIRINVSRFLNCRDVETEPDWTGPNFLGPNYLHFWATPSSLEPVFLTYEFRGPSSPQEISINELVYLGVIVKSWRHDGTPAPSIRFSWMMIGEKAEKYLL